MTQKSLFGKFIGLFLKPNKKSGGSTLSASQALNLQNAYISDKHLPDTHELPSYAKIVKQLYSLKPEIFNAALYYLQKIALNEPEETEDILSALKLCLSPKSKISAQNKNQIEQTIKNIIKSPKK